MTKSKLTEPNLIKITVFFIVILIINQVFLFKGLDDIALSIYFEMIIFAGIVVYAFLATASLYGAKTKVNLNFIGITWGSLVFLTNGIIAILMLAYWFKLIEIVMIIFLNLGKTFFTLSLFIPVINYKKIDDYLMSNIRLVVVTIGLFLLELILIYILYKLESLSASIVIAVNMFNVVLSLMLALEVLIQKNQVLNMIPVMAIVLANVILVLNPRTLNAYIQSMLLIVLAGTLFFYDLNHQNFEIPNREKENLMAQFNVYSKNLKKVIDKRTYEVNEVNQRIIDELEYAKEIQQSLLPSNHYTYQDVTFYSGYFPCERLSGDFYDVFRIDEDHIALYFLDVAGHGISAALMTMLSNNFLRSSDQSISRLWEIKPERTISHFYDHFNRLNIPDEMHLVIFYATYNLKTRELTYCSGGMNCAPILTKKSGQTILLEKSEGFPICKMDDFFKPQYKSAKITLDKGDRILFYTDGLIDKEKNNIYDMKSIVKEMKQSKTINTKVLNDKIFEKIEPFKDSLNDDITYIIMDV